MEWNKRHIMKAFFETLKCLRILSAIFLLSSLAVATAQTKLASKNKKALPLYQIIKGKWYSEADPDIVLNFKGNQCIEMYGKDTIDNINFVFSKSGNLNDTIHKKVNYFNKDVYFLLHAGNKVEECDLILNLSNDVLSWMNNRSGKIFAFKRIKQK